MATELEVQDKHPLLTAAAERSREIHARCVSVERACEAIGFTPGSCHERVAVLVARVAGDAVLRRTVRQIAADADVGFSVRQVRRAIDQLVHVGLLGCGKESSPDWRQVGRKPKVMLLSVRWAHVREVVAAEEKWRREHAGEVATKAVENVSTELRTSKGRHGGVIGTTCGQHADISVASRGRLADRSYLDPYSLSSPSSREESSIAPPIETNRPAVSSIAPAIDSNRPAERSATLDDDDEGVQRSQSAMLRTAVADAGVERIQSLLDEADRRGIPAPELIAAAYVCRHWSKLTPGALFDWVRSGGWPVGGVPTADRLREKRREAAETIRSRVRHDAAGRTPRPTERIIAAVICRRLRATRPQGCKTDLSDMATSTELAMEQAFKKPTEMAV